MYKLNVITNNYEFLIPFAIETDAYIRPFDSPDFDYFQLCFVDHEHYLSAKERLDSLFNRSCEGDD